MKHWVHAVWACRIPVITGIAGILLYWFVPQARALFADVNLEGGLAGTAVYWAACFVMLTWAWALPVLMSARIAVRSESWLLRPVQQAALRSAVARASGFLRAGPDNTVTVGNAFNQNALPDDARNALTGLALKDAQAALRRDYAGAIRFLPRICALVPFLAMVGASGREAWDLSGARSLPAVARGQNLAAVLCALSVIAVFLFCRLARMLDPDGNAPAAAAGVQAAPANGAAEAVTPGKVRRFMRDARAVSLDFRTMPKLEETSLLKRHARSTFGGWLIWIPVAVAFALALIAPMFTASVFPRALLMPLLFGGATLVFSPLARLSDSRGRPYVLSLVVVAILVSASNAGFHDIHAVDKIGARVDLHDEIVAWKAANQCDADKIPCPPAVVIAAEGGASRAAFFAGSVIGELLDTLPAAAGETDTTLPASRRIFAMSGVSGGSVGVALVHAALADRGAGKAPPCKYGVSAWFRNTIPGKWRDCLQLLASADGLTPVFVAIGFRDNFVVPWMTDDRAYLLEMAWERHYSKVVDGTAAACDETRTTGLCRLMGDRGRGKLGEQWVPVLFLNGTSVETGRRIVVSETRSWLEKTNPVTSVYQEAYDIFEMMAPPCKDAPRATNPDRCVNALPQLMKSGDLRLSTAAIISARFPVISPAGTIREPPEAKSKDVDRVVDGGVFENGGITTATDIARVLLRENIVPVILHINNDPRKSANQAIPPRAWGTPTVSNGGAANFINRAIGTLAAPVQALYDTRSGHAAEAEAMARKLLSEHCPFDNCFFDMNVWAETNVDVTGPNHCPPPPAIPSKMEAVTMSWWLQPAIQAYLDIQFCDKRTADELDHLRALMNVHKKPNERKS